MENSHSAAYAAAGVDIEAGYRGVQLMKRHVARTVIPGVVSGIGGFGGLFAPDLAGMKEPVLVSGTDGVGTKLRLAQLLGRHDTVGIDCVAMCVNDIICCGAKPLFFLDYIAIGKNEPEKVADIVSGVAEGCVRSGCALIGGETAEHPGVMDPDDYDIAGFAVGVVDKSKIIDGSRIQEGDALIGLTSSGVHSNGFSLVRKVFDIERTDLAAPMDALGGKSLGEALLAPTKLYVKPVLALLEGGIDLHGASHITGGGFYENVPRMLPEGLEAHFYAAMLPRMPIFDLIAKRGNISERDMYNTFNMGLGMVLAVPREQADKALAILRGAGEPDAAEVGGVCPGDAGVAFCEVCPPVV
ncbi:phosphoribosylformylglycinamidine cyclo-ligase [uncultured Oscillibacter sp.]|jgi:phosphoribosylformylglycinamidine cyclo-ligase|uniref:phosphoribosylformylglycinamidine cyclo-ligase n=1 Tax=uncultured Oscillibacter sp. TaxID=876091 RepID=UPI0025F8CDE2|nr:phosphoribosylformylglycinamidine cyclo-ligase [uncultured Oscillibacter sp.]